MNNTLDIKLPNVYIDYCADASIHDTLNEVARGYTYRKSKDEAYNEAWTQFVQALRTKAVRKQHHTEITVTRLQARVLVDDLLYFERLPNCGDFDPSDKPRMRRHGKACAKARITIETLLDRP